MFDFLAKELLVPQKFYSLFDVLFIAIIIMFIMLKIVALKRSWINGQKIWFVVLIVINTLGILEIIYLLTNPEKPAVKKEIKETEIDLTNPEESVNIVEKIPSEPIIANVKNEEIKENIEKEVEKNLEEVKNEVSPDLENK